MIAAIAAILKLAAGKNISYRPSNAPLLPHAGALKFAHQKI